MQPRKVIVTLEILTDAKVKDLEDKTRWDFDYLCYQGDTNFSIVEKPKVNVVKK